MKQWIREYRFVAGPKGEEGFKIESAGVSRPLHISFKLEKADTQASNTGTITLSNLSDEHKAILNKKDCYVELSAGYESGIGMIFCGTVSTTSETLSNADRDLEIDVVDGFANTDLVGWLSMNGVVTCSEVLDKIVKKMEIDSAIITDKAKEKLQSAKYDNGYCYVGKFRAALQAVLRKAGLTFSIQNGILQVYESGEAIIPKAYQLSADSGLISIPKKITISDSNVNSGKSSKSTSKSKKEGTASTADKGIPGYEVSYLLNPAIGVNDLISLKSKTVSGYFRVHKLSMDGDNYGGDWKCTAQLIEVKK